MAIKLQCYFPLLVQVMGVGTSVGRIGFYGPSYEKLWSLTHIETLRQVSRLGQKGIHIKWL